MTLCAQYAAYWPSAAQGRAECICTKESGNNPNAIGGAGEQGLWQILPSAHPECSGNLLDPATNARCAVAVSGNGQNWGPWTTASLCPDVAGGSSSPAAVASSVQSTIASSVASPAGLLVLGVGAVVLLLGANAIGDLA